MCERDSLKRASMAALIATLVVCQRPAPIFGFPGDDPGLSKPRSTPVVPVRDGMSLDRVDISPGEVRSYAVAMEHGQRIAGVAEQFGADVKVVVSGPTPSEPVAFDTPNEAAGPESFVVVADRDGEYRIDVVRLEEGTATGTAQQSGGFALRLEPVSAAVDDDRLLLEAVRANDRALTATGSGVARAWLDGAAEAIDVYGQCSTAWPFAVWTTAFLLDEICKGQRLPPSVRQEAVGLLEKLSQVPSIWKIEDTLELPAATRVDEMLMRVAVLESDLARKTQLVSQVIPRLRDSAYVAPAIMPTALSLASQLVGENRIATAFDVLDLCDILVERGPAFAMWKDGVLLARNAGFGARAEYDRALEFAERAFEIRKQNPTCPPLRFAEAAATLAVSRERCGDYAGARQVVEDEHLVETIMTMLRQRDPSLAPGVRQFQFEICLKVARVLESLSDGATALRICTEGMKAIDADPRLATNRPFWLNHMATAAQTMGNYGQAIEWFQQALDEYRRAPSQKTGLLEAVLMQNLGLAYLDSGNLALAENLFAEARPLYLAEFPDEATALANPEVQTFVANTAILANWQGDPTRARALYESIARQYPPDSSSPLALRARSGLGSALLLLSTTTPDEALSNNLLRDALALFQSVLQRYIATGQANHPNRAAVEYSIASTHLRLGNIEASLAHAGTSLSVYERVLEPRHPMVARVRGALGIAEMFAGDLDRAEQDLRAAVAALTDEASLGTAFPDAPHFLAALEQLELRRGDHAAAVRARHEADVLRERFITQNLWTGSQARNLAYLLSPELLLDADRAISLARSERSPESALEAFNVVLSRHGRAFEAAFDSFDRLRNRAVAAGYEPNEVETKLEGIQQAASALQHRIEKNSRNAEAIRQFVTDVERRSNEVIRMTGPIAARTVAVDDVRSRLDRGSALVEYFVYRPFNPLAAPQDSSGPPHYAAFVLERDTAPRFLDLGDAKAIDARVRTLLSWVRLDSPDHPPSSEAEWHASEMFVRATARDLDRMIFEPVRALLSEDVRSIYVAPDGRLCELPFAVLVDQNGKYLVDRYVFTHLVSGRDLVRLASSPQPQLSAPVIVTSPDYGASTTCQLRLSPVKYGARVSDAFAAWLPCATRFEGTAARKTAIQSLHRPGALLFWTHGDSSNTQPSALGTYAEGVLRRLTGARMYLARANDVCASGNDGQITSFEGSFLDLSGTELCILGICEGSQGLAFWTGDGAYGMSRGLLLAGVRTVVTTLWSVPEKETSDIVVDYIRRVQEGAGRSEALAEAQRNVLAEGNRVSRHPYFWSGIVTMGAPSPMPALPVCPPTKQ